MSKDIFIEAAIAPCIGSDHWLVHLEVDLKYPPKSRPFRFISFWNRNSYILKKMEEWWTKSTKQGQNRMHTFQPKLKDLKKRLKKWSREQFGHILKDQLELSNRMVEVQQKMIKYGRSEDLV